MANQASISINATIMLGERVDVIEAWYMEDLGRNDWK